MSATTAKPASHNTSHTASNSAAYATISGMKIPLRTPHWPYPTREPYFPCCRSAVRTGHGDTCVHASGSQVTR